MMQKKRIKKKKKSVPIQNEMFPVYNPNSYRNYFYVTSGSVKIKLASPKSSKYLHTIYDYDNFEFRSPINPWNPERKYITDFNKIKCLEITLNTDKILQIPPYWWYSIKFSKGACISVFKYTTYMNNISISNHYFLYLLQLQNVKRDNLKKLEIQSSSNNHIEQDQQEEYEEDMEEQQGTTRKTKKKKRKKRKTQKKQPQNKKQKIRQGRSRRGT